MKTKITIDNVPPSSVLRVQDLPEGTCYLKEGQVLIKQECGYSMALDNFVRYQVRGTEQVERVISEVSIRIEL